MHTAKLGYNPNKLAPEQAWSVVNEKDGTIMEFDLHEREAKIIADLYNQCDFEFDDYPF